ncbi:MAG: anti-sigma factor domain-containing protein, partial [Eubacteriales bacterium]
MVYEGTVVGLKKRSAVVMTGDCRFKEIQKTPAMSSGLKVHFTDADLFKPAVKAPLRFTAVAASLLVCFVLAYSLLQGITDKLAFAYINLEVNPALEISLDKEMKVIKVTGINRDGQDIAKGLKIREQVAGEAVQAALSACVESGYINGDHNRVLLATTFPVKNDKLQEELDYRIWEAARKSVAVSQSGAEIYILHVDPVLREQAIQKGVSAGRYLLWQDAQSNGLQFDLDGPLSGPGFSQSVGRLSLPFTERSATDNNAAPGTALPAMQGGRADQAPSSPPGSGAATGKIENKLRDHITPPGTGGGIVNGKEKGTGESGDTMDTGPADPGKP